jgi:tetratricopeptide (TPR) repeat protein
MLLAITSGKIHGQVDGEVAAVRQALEDASERGTEVPEVLKAEAEFMLGMLTERQDGYDLEQADRRYRHALALYLRSGFPLEADRLLNTWGHQKSLLFEIEEAGYLLNRSRAIKTLKGDRLGLAFTLGCLGDNHRRAGEFEEAIACYQEDLRTAESLGVDHSAASVTCKLAEAEICAGLVGEGKSLLDRGIERLRDLFIQDGLPDQVRFFAGKGLAKGLLWKAAAGAEGGHAKLLSDGEQVLSMLQPFSSYSAAHLDRLKGRLARIHGDHANAVTLLTRAKDAFGAMTRGVESRVSSLQAICCSIEAAMASAPQDGRDDKIRAACGDLTNFMESLQGLLGAARERMEPLLEAATIRGRDGVPCDSDLNRLIAFTDG